MSRTIIFVNERADNIHMMKGWSIEIQLSDTVPQFEFMGKLAAPSILQVDGNIEYANVVKLPCQ